MSYSGVLNHVSTANVSEMVYKQLTCLLLVRAYEKKNPAACKFLNNRKRNFSKNWKFGQLGSV